MATLFNSFETQATLYTGPYRCSVNFLSPNSKVFLGSDAVACYSREKQLQHSWSTAGQNIFELCFKFVTDIA